MRKLGFVFYIIVAVTVKLAVCGWVLLLISLYTLVKMQLSLARTYDTSSSAESIIPYLTLNIYTTIDEELLWPKSIPQFHLALAVICYV